MCDFKFNESVEEYNKSTPGHADEFNKRQVKLLENDKFLKEKIDENIKNFNKQLEDIKIPVTSVNNKTGAIVLKATDIKTADGTNLEEFKKDVTTQYEDCVKKIGNIKDLKTTNKDNLVESVNELFTNVDNGKDSLYSAIIGKKVMPKSKDFKDLTDAITDIKLGQGNVQAGEVLVGKTFTNDSGVMQTGTMPNMGSKEIIPKPYTQELGKGCYSGIKVKGINDLDDYDMKEV
ncbi:phage tail protein, partial [Clostridium botulinum]|nr:phage tail protein [Clostridium botulinum]NFV20276.1 phage tail protein [Clostridium botulinum]